MINNLFQNWKNFKYDSSVSAIKKCNLVWLERSLVNLSSLKECWGWVFGAGSSHFEFCSWYYMEYIFTRY